ncbi:MAG: putative transcriptional regulator, partial [Anaerocolumna sp.]|nr:putative transcriptional regulator [Anaerocolumna sp.]
SQEELSEKLNLSRQAVAKWESGQTYPDIENLIKLSDFYHVTIDSMVKDSSECEKSIESKPDINKQPFVTFLCKAKKATYPGQGKEEEVSIRPSSHDYIYKEDNFLYMDSFLGGEAFSGEEAVWIDLKPVWVMNYTGRTLQEEFSGSFLNTVLLQVKEELPFRGPVLYKEGDYTYHNHINGEFSWFHGREEIYYKDILVYECLYHGGIIK